MSRPALPRIAAGAAASVLCAVVGLVLTVQTSEFRARAEQTTGTVVRNTVRVQTASVGARAYFPIVRFQDRDGVTHTVRCEEGCSLASTPKYRTGESVAILYDPADPAQARIDSVFARFGLPVLCGVVAILGLIFLVLVPLHRRRAAV